MSQLTEQQKLRESLKSKAWNVSEGLDIKKTIETAFYGKQP